LQLFHCKI
jgi:hypothetical protein